MEDQNFTKDFIERMVKILVHKNQLHRKAVTCVEAPTGTLDLGLFESWSPVATQFCVYVRGGGTFTLFIHYFPMKTYCFRADTIDHLLCFK